MLSLADTPCWRHSELMPRHWGFISTRRHFPRSGAVEHVLGLRTAIGIGVGPISGRRPRSAVGRAAPRLDHWLGYDAALPVPDLEPVEPVEPKGPKGGPENSSLSDFQAVRASS